MHACYFTLLLLYNGEDFNIVLDIFIGLFLDTLCQSCERTDTVNLILVFGVHLNQELINERKYYPTHGADKAIEEKLVRRSSYQLVRKLVVRQLEQLRE